MQVLNEIMSNKFGLPTRKFLSSNMVSLIRCIESMITDDERYISVEHAEIHFHVLTMKALIDRNLLVREGDRYEVNWNPGVVREAVQEARDIVNGSRVVALDKLTTAVREYDFQEEDSLRIMMLISKTLWADKLFLETAANIKNNYDDLWDAMFPILSSRRWEASNKVIIDVANFYISRVS